jgi:cell division protein FtsA
VGIDVGSSKICTLVSEVDDEGDVCVIGVGLVPSRGIRKGVVVNVADATAAIAASVEKAERTSGYEIGRAYVGFSGTHVSSLNSRGVVGISRREHGIAVEDVDRALDAARAIAVPHNQEVVHVIPRGYMVDGQGGVRDPVGMHGFRLEVEAHIVTGSSTAIQNLVKCVEGAEVEVDELVLAGIAAGDAVLTDTEREMGVVLADIGAGTINIAIFIDGTVWHTVTLGMGGEYITGDISIGLRLPPATAERIKVQHGHARASQVLPEERFTVSPFEGEASQVVLRWKLAIQELGRDILGLPVRVGAPRELHGFVDTVSNPAHAVGAGLIGWGMTVDTRLQPRKTDPGVGRRFLNWLRVFLPG